MTDRLAILSARIRAATGNRPASQIILAAQPAPPAPMADTLLLTIREAAALCGVHWRTLRKWPLPWVVVGRVRRVRRVDLDAFLLAQREVPDAT